MNYNKVILAGRLTRDPEVRQTNTGKSVCNVALAVNRRGKKADGTPFEEALFVDVAIWGPRGEAFARYHKKGSTAMVEGRLSLDQWESDGEKRQKLKVIAEEWTFAESGRASSTDEAPKDDKW